MNNVIQSYADFFTRILETGSRVICSPPPEDTDDDYLVLIKPDVREALEQRLQDDGWTLGGSLPNTGPENNDWTLNTEHEYTPEGVIDQTRTFHSWKRQEIPMTIVPGHEDEIFPSVIVGSGPILNLLVTCNEQYFDDFTRATFLSKALNLVQKQDRILVFEALTRDVWPSADYKRKKSIKNSLLDSNHYIIHEAQTTPIGPTVTPTHTWWSGTFTGVGNN